MARGRPRSFSVSAPGPRNVNDALVNKSKKKARTQRQQFLQSYEDELGLQPGSRAVNGVVVEATCKFCTRFGREDDNVGPIVDPYQISSVLAKPKRKKTTNPKVFTSFRRDNITGHMTSQHPRKWAEFQKLPLSKPERTAFFAKDETIVDFLPKGTAFEFRIPPGVMTTLKSLFFQLSEDGESPVVPDGFIELETGDFLIAVTNRDQFEVIVRCVGSSVSFKGTVKLFQVFGRALGNMKLGRPNEQMVRQSVRYVAAINLTVFKELLRRVWGFSVMVDGATHQSQGYLDVRMTFGLQGAVHNFHFLAIPTGDRSHTGELYAELVLDALRSVAGERVLMKLIGMATDGAATMLGCHRGFVTRVKAACAAVGGANIVANWCGSHQLNLVVDSMLDVMDEFARFRSTLGGSWWLCLFLIADIAREIKICFAKLQYKKVTMSEQYEALHALARTMQNRFEDNDFDGASSLSEVKVEAEVCNSAPFSRQLYQTLYVEEQQQLILAVGDAVKQLINGVMDITLTVSKDGSSCDLSTPMAIVQATDDEFSDILEKHQQRLTYQHGGAIISNIWNQRKDLKKQYQNTRSVKAKIERVSTLPVNEAWSDSDFDRLFRELKIFALGLASIPPGTHTVESDFSILKRVRSPTRSRLTNFSMEGEMHATQFFDLVSLAESAIAAANV